MIFIILGVIAFFASLTLRKMEHPLPRYSGVLRFVALGLVVLGFLTACVKQIDAGQNCIQSRYFDLRKHHTTK